MMEFIISNPLEYIFIGYYFGTFQEQEFYNWSKLQVSIMSKSNYNFTLSDNEWQTILDALSNTIFNQDLTEDARKNAKELFLKLQKEIPNK
jgi:hypothetical protein